MGWMAGATAAATAALVLLVQRLFLGGPSLPEVLQDAIVGATPGPVFAALLDRLRFAGRPLLFGAILCGTVLVGAVVGRAYAASPRASADAVRLGVLVYGLLGLAVFPLLGAGPFGLNRPGAPLWLTSALSVLVYVRVLHGLVRWAGAPEADADAGRRRALGQVALAGSLAGLSALAWRLGAPPGARGAPARPPAPGSPLPEHPTPDITPVGVFYNVSKNFLDPRRPDESWRLRVDGLVDAPFELTLEQLRALPAVEQPATLCCISNEVGGELIGNAHWKGVRLADLLGRASVRAGGVDVVFHCGDDYRDSIAIDRALMPGTLVVYEMNGAPLTEKHGFPARVIVPGIFGMKNAKWLRRVEVVPDNFLGFWQQQGWSDAAPYLTMSRIDWPVSGVRIRPGPGAVHGIAFGGDRGISRVEVSVDGGASWREAGLMPPTGPFSWVRWTLPWDATASPRAILKVRAYDGFGEPQIEAAASSFPDGATGYHAVVIRVAEG